MILKCYRGFKKVLNDFKNVLRYFKYAKVFKDLKRNKRLKCVNDFKDVECSTVFLKYFKRFKNILKDLRIF